MKKISTESYKGVRDFYPKDWMIQKYIFQKMSQACELFGYLEYNASPLEPTELFLAKSGSEIIQNETYNLKDRADREITLRPEMTPTLARLIAGKKTDLQMPIRFFSIPNLFRYEKPQKGRLREHYQLNADIFGTSGIEAEIEILFLVDKIMKNFGAKKEDYVIKINNRKILNSFFQKFSLTQEKVYEISKIIDKKEKIGKEKFEESLEKFLKDEQIIELNNFFSKKDNNYLRENYKEDFEKLEKIIESCKKNGIENIVFDFSLTRGFDYYTDFVFEIFDTDPENNRSMAGGGRYDDLLDIFGQEKIPAVGFGMGDVTMREFLISRNLIPEDLSKTKILIAVLEEKFLEDANFLAKKLRDQQINTEIDFTFRKIFRQINSAEKKGVENILIFGESEKNNEIYNIKNLKTQKEERGLNFENLLEKLKV